MTSSTAQFDRSRFAFVGALYVFAFFSGTAALIYEVAWTKMLALTFGRTTLAASSVVGGFMVGMGIGAWLYHRAQGHRIDALRLYVLLEIGIVLSTALLTPALVAMPDLFASMAVGVPAGTAMNLFRIVFVAIVLLVPAALMGATYPALCTVLIRSREGVARHLGPLYGLNTIGAAIGALLAGFVLVEQLGLEDSVRAANGINLCVAAAAWWLGRGSTSDEAVLGGVDDEESVLPTRLPGRITGIVLFGSGFATLAYEIVWFRALRYLFGNSTYAFTVMMVVFLIGLGIGGLLCGRTLQRSYPERNLALCQLGIAILALAAIAAEAFVLGNRELESSVSIFVGALSALPWWHRLLIDLGVALALMLPATLLMGFSFPLASRLFLGDVRRLGERVGTAVLLANLGSIVGSVTAALLLLPELGTIGATRAIAVVNLSLGALLLAWLPWRLRTRLALGLGTAAIVFSSFVALPRSLPFRISEFAFGSARMDLIFEEEGDVATVQVWALAERPESRAITVDGTSIGESEGIRMPIYAKQVMLAHLPMVIDPEIRSSLNIGLGSGSTLNALASYPHVETLHAVEISGAVVRGSMLFEESKVYSDPRTHIVVEDIAHFLLSSIQTYDLIISDGKLGRDFSGNALMLCRDFYEHASERLSDDGMLIQWLPMEFPPSVFQELLRTALASFPEVEIFFKDPGGVFLVGSRTPITGRSRGTLAIEQARRDLAVVLIPSAEALLSRWVASGDDLRRVVGDGPISTWDKSRLEYAIFRSTGQERRKARSANLKLLLDASALSDGNPYLPEDSSFVRSTKLLRRARYHGYRAEFEKAERLAQRALDAEPGNPQASFALHKYREAGQAHKRH